MANREYRHIDHSANERPCRKCKRVLSLEHFSKDKSRVDGLSYTCKQCVRDNCKKHYKDNRERYAERHEKWRSGNKERIVSWNKQYNKENKELIANRKRQYIATHKEQKAASKKRWQQSERGKVLTLIYCANRRARKKNALGSHTAEELQEQLIRQSHKCYYCQGALGDKRSSYHADHIVPISRGGTNYIHNIVLTCSTCNLKKGNKMLHEWIDGGRLC